MSSEPHGPYHRTGEPGGPGADVAAMPIEAVAPDGERIAAHLLDAQGDADEAALLRTICHTLGVTWGHDDLGWWAVVPATLRPPEALSPAG
jgi:hypothetical protein